MLTQLRWTAYRVRPPKACDGATVDPQTLWSPQHCPALQGPRAMVRWGRTMLSPTLLPLMGHVGWGPSPNQVASLALKFTYIFDLRPFQHHSI